MENQNEDNQDVQVLWQVNYKNGSVTIEGDVPQAIALEIMKRLLSDAAANNKKEGTSQQ